MNNLEELKKYIKEYDKDYEIKGILETNTNYIAYVETNIIDYDIPVFVQNKNTGKIMTYQQYESEFENIIEDAKVVKNYEEGNDMEQEKIRKLLKMYGAEDAEIENFMQDLAEMKEEVSDDNSFSMTDHYETLKMTEEGKDLIEKAPTMKKEELEQAVKAYLGGK